MVVTLPPNGACRLAHSWPDEVYTNDLVLGERLVAQPSTRPAETSRRLWSPAA